MGKERLGGVCDEMGTVDRSRLIGGLGGWGLRMDGEEPYQETTHPTCCSGIQGKPSSTGLTKHLREMPLS